MCHPSIWVTIIMLGRRIMASEAFCMSNNTTELRGGKFDFCNTIPISNKYVPHNHIYCEPITVEKRSKRVRSKTIAWVHKRVENMLQHQAQ